MAQKIIDMTGWVMKEHGVLDSKLTVIKRIANDSHGGTRWECQCECGGIVNATGQHIRNGNTKSCGCLRKEKIKNIKGRGPIKIIPKGTRFGHLTVLEESDKRKDGLAMWKCKCDCGKEIEVRGCSLRNGQTKSCGCKQGNQIKIIPIGSKFGKLTVLELLDKRQNNETVYQCQCECGKVINVCRGSLLNGNTSSCGCLKQSKGELKIQEILQSNNIIFEMQKRFDDCKDIKPLPFDFFINNEYLIEFDGIQHFKVIGWATEEIVMQTQKHDKIKNEWCKENNISLIRIPYTHLKDLCIEDLLLETSNFIVE